MTLPLFDDETTLEERLRMTFKSWVEHRAQSVSGVRSERPLREESATVYQEMWHAFAAYCSERKLDLARLEPQDIETFLAIRGAGDPRGKVRITTKAADLSPRYAWRLLTLIDRVCRFHAHREGTAPNTAAHDLLQRPEYRFANASHHDPLPEYYGEAQAKRLIAYLTQVRDKNGSDSPMSWKEVRDRTAVATMLGGGLTPGDVRALTLDGVCSAGGRKMNLPWKLSLPGNGNSPARETPLAEWAGRQLAFWLGIRVDLGIEGDVVFPATLSGKGWSHTACHDACKAVLAGAGMGQEAGGMYKLRHTFAVRQLAKGQSESDVARWLGLVDLNGMARYRRIVPHHVDVV